MRSVYIRFYWRLGTSGKITCDLKTDAIVYDDCIGEVGPWKAYTTWDTCGEGTKNTLDELTFLRSVYKGLIDISTELRVDADRRTKWQYILDHLSPYPTTSRDGKKVFRGAEN